MNIHKASILLSLIFLISACAPQKLPDPTMTSTPTKTVVPTATSSATPTFTPTSTATTTATASPIPLVEKVIFSDTFDDNSNHWDLNSFTRIKDGSMQIKTGGKQFTGILLPIKSTPHNVMLQVDILPNPPAGTDPSILYFYGVGCRVNKTGSDFYFFGITPIPGESSFFMATFLQLKDTKQVNYQVFPIELPKAHNGDGFMASFLCSENKFNIMDGNRVLAEETINDSSEGSLLLGIMQLDGIAGGVKFDNLTVSEVN